MYADTDEMIVCLEEGDEGYDPNHPVRYDLPPTPRVPLGKADPEREKKITFLAYYEGSGNLWQSCKVAKIVLAKVERWLDEDTDFKTAYARAQRAAGNLLEAEAKRRAVEGSRKYRFDKGYPVMWKPPESHPDYETWLPPEDHPAYKGEGVEVVKSVHYYELVYSDALLMFLMKGAMPEKYGDKLAHTGEVGMKLYAFDPSTVGSKSIREIQELQAGGERPSSDAGERPGDTVLRAGENWQVESMPGEDSLPLHGVSGVPGSAFEADEAEFSPVDSPDL